MLLASETAEPEGPAGLPRVTTPVDELPADTTVGFRLKATKEAGLTVNFAV